MVTVNIQELLIWVLLVLLIIASVYMIIVLKTLVQTLNKTNKILDDGSTVSGIVAEKAENAEETVDNIIDSAGQISDAMKGNEGTLASVSNIFRAVVSTAGVIKSSMPAKKDSDVVINMTDKEVKVAKSKKTAKTKKKRKFRKEK